MKSTLIKNTNVAKTEFNEQKAIVSNRGRLEAILQTPSTYHVRAPTWVSPSSIKDLLINWLDNT